MWVVFRKSDGTVVGASADSDTDIKKETALAEIFAGLEKPGNPEDYDAFQVKERGTLQSWAESAGRGMVRVQPSTLGGMKIVVEKAPSPVVTP